MNIGVVTTESDLRDWLAAEVRANQHEAVCCDELTHAVTAGCGLVFAQWSGGERLPRLLAGLKVARERNVSVVALVPSGAVALFHRARAEGAADVLYLPPDAEEIRAEIEDLSSSTREAAVASPEKFREMRRSTLVGEDRAFLRCLDDLRRAAKSEANVLLIGETGTGKEMFALALHLLSNRAGKTYLPVNCAGLPGTLLEAELFGHTKGAFTGAERERVGRFEEVGEGTLLLDEVGDLDLPFQTKLLRVLEQRIYQRLGENRDRRFAARLVSATSVNLDQAVAAGTFRPDLLSRLEQFRIHLPALRERRADIPILTRHFLQKHAQGRLVELSKTALEILDVYAYPRNVRQLENVLREALIRSEPGRVILPKHLPRELVEAKAASVAPVEPSLSIPLTFGYREARDYALRIVDQHYLGELLAKHHNNQSRVAEELDIDRKTLRERLRHFVGDASMPTED